MSTYLGQNFLTDPKVKSYIAACIERMYTTCACEALVEIGPGKGALTRKICQISPHFFVIEKDTTLLSHLEPIMNREDIVLADVLDVDVEKILRDRGCDPRKTLIVGNLPYYITSPIIRQFFATAQQTYAGGVFLIQKEVGEKLMTEANKKSYLRRLINFAHTVYYKRTVGPKSFSPPPKVASCVIAIASSTKEHQHTYTEDMYQAMQHFLEHVNRYKRKTLGKIEKMIQKKEPDCPWTIPEFLHAKRLEEVARDEMLQIISQKCKE